MEKANIDSDQYQILDLHEESYDTFIGQAETLVEAGDFPGALKIYHGMLDKIGESHPVHFEIFKNMGNIYLKCGDVDAAEEKYNQANAINNEDENLTINYGVLEIQKGQYTAARKRFSKVIEQNSQSDVAWVGLALVHRAHADHELARACTLRGLDENPYNKLAITNYYQWSYQDGVDADNHFLSSYLEKYPEDQDVLRISRGLFQ